MDYHEEEKYFSIFSDKKRYQQQNSLQPQKKQKYYLEHIGRPMPYPRLYPQRRSSIHRFTEK